MRRLLAAALAAVLLLTAAQPAYAHDWLVSRTNAFRVDHDLRPLRTNDNLDRLAHRRARQIVGDGFFHSFEWVNQTHCEVGGENLAYRKPALPYGERVAWFIEAWKNSPTHRALMLGTGWRRMGAAIYVAPDGAMYGVQLFCDPR
jgi:uncharacterized protein YkwD